MQSYDIFSIFYDRLTFNINYKKQADYLLRLFNMYSDNGEKPATLVDLGCGTGSLTLELAKNGISTIGVDMSCGMLNEAMQKLDELSEQEQRPDVMFVCQKIQSLELPYQVDAAICTLDSINHLKGADMVQRFLNRLSSYVRQGGLFIFDANTPYKHESILGNNTFVYDMDDVFCVWQNDYDDSQCKVTINLDFFEKIEKQGDSYHRSHERFCEYAYTDEQMIQMLKNAGFDVVNIFNEMSFESPKDDCQRKVFVTRKMED